MAVEVGDVVGEQLEGNHSEDVLDAVGGAWHADHMTQATQVALGHVRVADDERLARSRQHLLESIQRLLKHTINTN